MTEVLKFIATKGLEFMGRYYGLYRGFVESNDDPEQAGRLILKIPQIYGAEPHDYWACPFGMFAGKNIGFFAVPNVGDIVWVSFENGDPEYPLWTYGYFGTGDLMDKAKHEYPKTSVFQTTSGNKISSLDKEKKIEFQQADGRAIDISKDLINLGTLDKASEAAVLGDTATSEGENLADILIDICTELMAETHLTPAGMSAPPTNLAKYAALKTKLTAWKSNYKIIKSKIVRLD